MKTKPIPAIIMLIAGFVTCIMSIYNHLDLGTFTKTLLLVLIIFYILGCVVQIILDRNFKDMEDENKKETQEMENAVTDTEENLDGMESMEENVENIDSDESGE